MIASAYTLPDWRELEARLADVLTPQRFRHTLGVSDTACALASRYGVDYAQARLAGLLHDCAKSLLPEELHAIVAEEGLDVRESELANPPILHAPVGAWLAKTQYGVEEDAVLSAIRFHTTGRPEMTLLEKIIYTADYIEPCRTRAPDLEQIRVLAFTDLNAAVAGISNSTVAYILERQIPMDEITRETRDWYRTFCGKGELS